MLNFHMQSIIISSISVIGVKASPMSFFGKLGGWIPNFRGKNVPWDRGCHRKDRLPRSYKIAMFKERSMPIVSDLKELGDVLRGQVIL